MHVASWNFRCLQDGKLSCSAYDGSCEPFVDAGVWFGAFLISSLLLGDPFIAMCRCDALERYDEVKDSLLRVEGWLVMLLNAQSVSELRLFKPSQHVHSSQGR